jgi:hypothetical protein
MAMVRVEAQIASDDLLKAVQQLDPASFEHFAERIIDLRARRRAPLLPADEADLLARINAGLPETIERRYDELIVKRRAERLTPEEQAELLHLTDQVEARQAERAEQIARLARARGLSPARLMADLGLQPKPIA